jgi:hypothetical protein
MPRLQLHMIIHAEMLYQSCTYVELWKDLVSSRYLFSREQDRMHKGAWMHTNSQNPHLSAYLTLALYL